MSHCLTSADVELLSATPHSPTKSAQPKKLNTLENAFICAALFLNTVKQETLSAKKTTKCSMSHTSASMQNANGLRFYFQGQRTRGDYFKAGSSWEQFSLGLDSLLSISLLPSLCPLCPPYLRPLSSPEDDQDSVLLTHFLGGSAEG